MVSKKEYSWTEGLQKMEKVIDQHYEDHGFSSEKYLDDLYKEHEEKTKDDKFTKDNKKIIDLVDKFIHATHRNTLCLSLLGREDADSYDSPVQYATLLFLFIQLRYNRINEEQLQMMINSSEDLGHAMLLKNVIAYGQQLKE